MKQIIAMAWAAVVLAACNDAETDRVTVDTSDAADTTATTTTTTTTTTYTPAEGDVTYRNSKVMVMRNGEWVEADKDVELENGIVVHRNGRVEKDGREIELEEGEVVSKTGEFFDKAGRTIENAWEATKEGVKDAGRAIEKTAEKVGEKVENAVKDKDNE